MAIADARSASDRGDRAGRPRGAGSSLERVTINLTPRSSKALQEASAITGDTKTDTINRAVQLYEFVEQIHQAGGTVYIRPEPDADLERLRLL